MASIKSGACRSAGFRCGLSQLGVIADRELIPRPGELLEAMRFEFERLVLLVLLGAAELGY